MEQFIADIYEQHKQLKYLYRLYDHKNNFLKETYASSYVEAKKIFNSTEGDKIFSIEEDGHEILCGVPWLKDFLDNPANRE